MRASLVTMWGKSVVVGIACAKAQRQKQSCVPGQWHEEVGGAWTKALDSGSVLTVGPTGPLDRLGDRVGERDGGPEDSQV